MKLILPLEKNSYFKNQFQNYKTQLEKGLPKQNNILIQNFHDFGSHYQTVYAEASFQGSFYLISEKNTVVFKEDKMILTLQTPQKIVTFSEPITGEPFINIKTYRDPFLKKNQLLITYVSDEGTSLYAIGAKILTKEKNKFKIIASYPLMGYQDIYPNDGEVDWKIVRLPSNNAILLKFQETITLIPADNTEKKKKEILSLFNFKSLQQNFIIILKWNKSHHQYRLVKKDLEPHFYEAFGEDW